MLTTEHVQGLLDEEVRKERIGTDGVDGTRR